MGKDNYAVAKTDRTLLVADLRRALVSEVPWQENIKVFVDLLSDFIRRLRNIFIHF